MRPNEKHLTKALEALGLEGGNPRATPGVEARRTGRDDAPDLSPDKAKLFRSVTMCYLHDREDAQFDINYLTSCISSP
eukprot:4981088-Pyramimonas_sp.AAC.1